MKKNVYRTNEIKFLNGAKFTRYDVDVETLSEEDDWKNYKRMEILPGDLININGVVSLKVVADLPGEESCDACALTCVCSGIHKIGGSKEAALCMMCDCGEFRKDAPCVHLEEV